MLFLKIKINNYLISLHFQDLWKKITIKILLILHQINLFKKLSNLNLIFLTSLQYLSTAYFDNNF